MNKLRGLIGVLCAVSIMLAQEPAPPAAADETATPAPALTPDQLDTLVAPIALYPDPLLSQLLVASTYPLEVVEANQWLAQNKQLTGQALLDAAKQQNWDPSVQGLVAFPQVVAQLNQDVRWTTDLGNAFLAQQADVMSAVQRMRAKAQSNGKLKSTEQQTVNVENQDGQSAITIEPANPQVIYVPTYNPEWVWGPPVWGIYPPLFYPGIGIGFGFGPGIFIGGFFGGCCGWGAFGWGWGPNWFGHSILVNNYFLHRYGFHDFHGGEFRGTGVWAHDPAHRLGVPYPNRGLGERFRGGEAARGFGGARSPAFRGGSPAARGGEAGGARFGSQGFERQNPGANHSVFGGIHNGGQTRIQSDHGFSTMHGGGGFGGGASRGGGGGGGFHGGGGGGGGHRGR